MQSPKTLETFRIVAKSAKKVKSKAIVSQTTFQQLTQNAKGIYLDSILHFFPENLKLKHKIHWG